MRRLLPLALLPLLAACTDLMVMGIAGIEQRRTMNDMQARATLAATCDISLGAYYRVLTPSERRVVAGACGAPDAALALSRPLAAPAGAADGFEAEGRLFMDLPPRY